MMECRACGGTSLTKINEKTAWCARCGSLNAPRALWRSQFASRLEAMTGRNVQVQVNTLYVDLLSAFQDPNTPIPAVQEIIVETKP